MSCLGLGFFGEGRGPRYQRIYATFYDTPPNPKALQCSEPVPGVILSTTGDGFNSIGLHNGTRKGDSKYIWKVFSPAPLTDEQSKRLFPSGPKCETFGWWAYPRYSKLDRQPKDTPFCLDGAWIYIDSKVISVFEDVNRTETKMVECIECWIVQQREMGTSKIEPQL